jgi:hypothetical protein
LEVKSLVDPRKVTLISEAYLDLTTKGEIMDKKHQVLYLMWVAVALLLIGETALAQSATSSVFATGLKAPTKIITTPKGNLMVSEAGMGPNTGRISILDFNGNRRTLIDGMPSGFAPPNGAPSGPSGLGFRGRMLYVVIGAGDGTVNGPTQGSELPNLNPSSPFLSSVLSIRLSPQAEATTQGFTMTVADQQGLLNNGFVKLTDAADNQLLIEVVRNFPNYTFDFPTTVRASNPFGIVLKGTTLYVVDASQNVIYEIDSDTGESRTLIHFPAKPNPLPFGPRFLDAVPNSIRLVGKSLVVSFLTGAPFPAGAAEVRKIRLVNTANEPLVSGLTSAIDALPVKSADGQDLIYTLEFSTNMLAQPAEPGRLSRFNPADGSLTVLLNNLVSPTSLARDEASGTVFVTEIFTGRIIRVQIQ